MTNMTNPTLQTEIGHGGLTWPKAMSKLTDGLGIEKKQTKKQNLQAWGQRSVNSRCDLPVPEWE